MILKILILCYKIKEAHQELICHPQEIVNSLKVLFLNVEPSKIAPNHININFPFVSETVVFKSMIKLKDRPTAGPDGIFPCDGLCWSPCFSS